MIVLENVNNKIITTSGSNDLISTHQWLIECLDLNLTIPYSRRYYSRLELTTTLNLLLVNKCVTVHLCRYWFEWPDRWMLTTPAEFDYLLWLFESEIFIRVRKVAIYSNIDYLQDSIWWHISINYDRHFRSKALEGIELVCQHMEGWENSSYQLSFPWCITRSSSIKHNKWKSGE